MRLGFERRGTLGEIAGKPGQNLPVDRNAARFHAGKHRGQRPLLGFVKRRHPLGGKPRLQDVPETHGHIGIFGSVTGGGVDLDFGKGLLPLARADQLLDRNAGVAEPMFGEFGHGVEARAIQRIGQQQRVVDCVERDAVAQEDAEIVFDVVTDLEDRAVFEHRLDQLERDAEVHLALGPATTQNVLAGFVANRDVGAVAGRGR